MLPKIKSKAFIRLLPQIFELREHGYSYEEVTAILEKQHGLILSVKQFSVYLARYKNTNAKKSAKQIAGSASPPLLDQQDAQLPVNSGTQMSDYAFGSPEYKAKIQKETEELFRLSQKTGLKHP
jgi:intein-encoded DNA endonuclease-like protein